MYAVRRHLVKQWDHEQPEKRYSVTVMKGGKPVTGIRLECISVVEEEVMYWRKANHIHAWFVENVQNGQDDCGTYHVPEEKLHELLVVCKHILEKSELVDGMTDTGTPDDHEHPSGIAMREAGQVLKDNGVARLSLPRQAEFFFGSPMYDETIFGTFRKPMIGLSVCSLNQTVECVPASTILRTGNRPVREPTATSDCD